MNPIREEDFEETHAGKGGRRVDVASIRRDQIVDAAIEVIAGQGLHGLSLSKIEEKTGMKRGQLTYYFPAKEEILLAVFDRLLHRMIQRMHEDHDLRDKHGLPPAWDVVRQMFHKVLQKNPADDPLRALEYTFLAQVEYREDFRGKLAGQYEEWRRVMGLHWTLSAKPEAEFAGMNSRTFGSFVQAVVHGLNVQMTADPDAFDRAEMLQLCTAILRPLFTTEPAGEGKGE